MQPMSPAPALGIEHQKSLASGVFALLGRVVVAGLVVAAGCAGWFAAERYIDELLDRPLETTTSATAALPLLGGGLPNQRLVVIDPWRRFTLTYTDGVNSEHYWFDLDTWKLRAELSSASSADFIEIHGDQGFRRTGLDGEWIAQDAATTRGIAGYVMGGIGPFVLTDLVPPNTLGFTTLELEGTSRGERVYEVAVDAATLRERHPLAYERWVTTTRIVGDGSGLYRIRVRPDGYIVRIDGESSSLEWGTLRDVEFFSPLAALASAPQATLPLQPGVDVSVPLQPAD
jgi:hypothetical protein